MDSIKKVAEAHEFRTLVRKFGSALSIRIAGDDCVTVTSRDPDALAAIKNASFTNLVIARGHPSFSSYVYPQNGKYWVWEKDILKATEMYGTGKLQKFSWDPRSGDFYFVPVGQQHATVQMKAPFDDHVRGIILHNQGLVTLRPLWPSWAQEPGRYSDDEVAGISFDAQHACKRALELHGSEGWKWQMNISNRDLEEMTGTHRW